jgi:hypothetical protein
MSLRCSFTHALTASLLLVALVLPAAHAKCSSKDTVLDDVECEALCASDFRDSSCGSDKFKCNSVLFDRQCCLKTGSSPKAKCDKDGQGIQECYCSISGIRSAFGGIIGGIGVITLLLLLCCCCCCYRCFRKKKTNNDSHA